LPDSSKARPDTHTYWDTYYRITRGPAAPSQFGVFVHGEAPDGAGIVDIGCGSGRDAIFFAQHGNFVLGIDQSANAISICKERAATLGLANCDFVDASISRSEDAPKIQTAVEAISNDGRPIVVYARFFLHAIHEDEENAFFDAAVDWISRAPEGMIAVEFRTARDQYQGKETPDHYRRFLSSMGIGLTAIQRGLKIDYFVEGFGFAKYRNDDAHVARYLFSNA
jgi:SAM-dependent methyltransferase